MKRLIIFSICFIGSLCMGGLLYHMENTEQALAYKKAIEMYEEFEQGIIEEEDFEIRENLRVSREKYANEVVDKLVAVRDSSWLGGGIYFEGNHLDWVGNHLDKIDIKVFQSCENGELPDEWLDDFGFFSSHISKVSSVYDDNFHKDSMVFSLLLFFVLVTVGIPIQDMFREFKEKWSKGEK